MFLGLFLTTTKINGKGGYLPIADGFFLKTNRKKLAERGVTTPVTQVFEPFPYNS